MKKLTPKQFLSLCKEYEETSSFRLSHLTSGLYRIYRNLDSSTYQVLVSFTSWGEVGLVLCGASKNQELRLPPREAAVAVVEHLINEPKNSGQLRLQNTLLGLKRGDRVYLDVEDTSYSHYTMKYRGEAIVRGVMEGRPGRKEVWFWVPDNHRTSPQLDDFSLTVSHAEGTCLVLEHGCLLTLGEEGWCNSANLVFVGKKMYLSREGITDKKTLRELRNRLDRVLGEDRAC